MKGFSTDFSLSRMCQVSKLWRRILNTCYVWKRLSLKCGISMSGRSSLSSSSNCQRISDPVDDQLSLLCECGMVLSRTMKWKRNYRNGKYTKRYLPSLHTNIFEETERFSSCLSIDSRRIVFGSEQGSLVIWQPSPNKSLNLFLKHKICDNKLNLVHIYGDGLAVIEEDNLHIFSIHSTVNLQLMNTFKIGYFKSVSTTNLTYCFLFNRKQIFFPAFSVSM